MIEPISKNNPVWLYKIVRSSNKNSSRKSFKEFVLVKAWSSKNSDKLNPNKRYFDYFYKGKIHRNQEVAIDQYWSYETSTSFNIWMYDRNDKLAIDTCRSWLKSRNDISRKSIRKAASKLIEDSMFTDNLNIVEDDINE